MRARGQRDPAAVEREARLDAAIEQHHPDLFERLVQAVGDADEEVRSTAAYGLSEMQDPRAIRVLLGLVDTDPSEHVVDHALKSLESYRGEEILAALLREARRTRRSRPPRWHVANQLRFYDDPRSIATLVELLQDEDAFVQQAALDSLVQLRPAERERWEGQLPPLR
jgi:HEAT repeat protein